MCPAGAMEKNKCTKEEKKTIEKTPTLRVFFFLNFQNIPDTTITRACPVVYYLYTRRCNHLI